jgi:predicted nucleic acid-binding protein
MKDKIFLDTNIIVYAFDIEHNNKRQISKELIGNFFNDDSIIISTQVVQEFCSVALTKMDNRISIETLEKFIRTFPESKIEIINRGTISSALKIKNKYNYSFWDSLIISSAINAGCSIIYSEDMSHGHGIGELKIVNPYR